MKIFKYTLIFLLSVGFYSCEDDLDILPEDDQSPEQVFSSEAGANGALVGVYSLAQQDDVLNGTSALATEWQSDNVDFVGSFPTFNDIRTYDTRSTNTSIQGIYDDSYEVINAANRVIAFVPEIADETFLEEDRANIVAQAKFMRALVYFKLADLFAQPLQVGGGTNLAVPLVVNPVNPSTATDEELFPKRATLNEVHTQIEIDLVDAIPALTNSDNSRATQAAAQQLLARLYLYQERFEEAATLSNDAINSSFQLAENYEFYNDQSPEHLFTLVNTSADGQDSGQGFSGLTNPAPTGRGDAPFTDNLIAAYLEEFQIDEDGNPLLDDEGNPVPDARYTDLIQIGTSAPGNARVFTAKFPDGVNNADNAPVLRITEAYLTRAEANLRNGSSIGADPLTDINLLRARAGLVALSAVTLDDILNERRKELAFEGQRRMDLLRNGLDLRRAGMPNEVESAFGADKTIFPIPNREIELSQLEQNPGY
ncbi:RagB/SusD family nutrient uptake outer membrane protein [Dokdonia donghaensis]|uniref:Carbohydrate-binding protein SusD n=1 Tax=Dokdonia donghaensis DSW-1 TaxID=1300343 RepID=A0A0A2GR67_9FLAO|nr:RagB/SusD family nutrient uptake outer membrane protein [Dokdonia donghaensis]ANH60956.1 SusD family protein [Dokdonia donghaensis DSW-1]KGO05799.1 hypothetical protein NV36_02365 [Dokdonia donghaensis DSW-1]